MVVDICSKDNRWKDRLGSVAIDEPRRTTALQAADLVVYELGRKLTNPNRYPFKNLDADATTFYGV